MTTNWRLGLGFSLLTAFMWGGLPISLKVILVDMDSITVTWYRFSVSALIAICWYGHRSAGGIRRLLSPPLWPLTLLAVAGILGNYVFYVIGLDYTTAEAAQILIQFAPLLLLLGGVFLFREAFSALQWLGVGGVVIGLLLFFHHRLRALSNVDEDYLIGMFFILVASITWAGYGLAQKRLMRHVNVNDLLLLIYIAGSLCLLPASSPSQALQLDRMGLLMLAFASLNTLIAYGSLGFAMSHWEASRVSAIIPLAPLLTLFLVYLSEIFYPGFVEAEPLDWMNLLGALLVVSGSMLAALGGRFTARPGQGRQSQADPSS